MIGEASHGTQEFYHHRAEISKLLIKEKGFNAIFLEADWPDTHLVNEYVQNSRNNTSKNAIESLRGWVSKIPTLDVAKQCHGTIY